MPSLQIDKQNGQVHLPDGSSIGPDLTQGKFKASPTFGQATSRDYGTLPFIHYQFNGGQIDGKILQVSLCFYAEVLLDVSLTANFYPPEAKDWSHYSLEVEAKTKQFHDQLLEAMLGRPSRGGSVVRHRLPKIEKTLDRPLAWKYEWGNVTSSHDNKGGGTYIVVNYGDRKREANAEYSKRR